MWMTGTRINKMPNAYDDYQEFCKTTAVYPGKNTVLELCYLFLGLEGEYREWEESNDFDYKVAEYKHSEKEAGDVLWYAAMICSVLGFSFSKLIEEADTIPVDLYNTHEVMKKYVRDGKNPTEALWSRMRFIINDVWYYHHDLYKIMDINKAKLSERKDTGTLQGDGESVDERK